MKKFTVPKGPVDIITFGDHEEKLVNKDLAQIVYFPDEDKIFVPLSLCGDKGFLFVSFDSTPVFKIAGNKEYFVDSDYVIEEKLLDDEMLDALKKLKARALRGEFKAENL